MFHGILKKYDEKGSFIFNREDDLRNKCNAPNDKSGVYLIYNNDTNELIDIGRSGEINADGTMLIRQTGMGGIKDRLVNGKQFGAPRHHSWPRKMREEGIKSLRIEWYITHNKSFADCPKEVKNQLLTKYQQIMGNTPHWHS